MKLPDIDDHKATQLAGYVNPFQLAQLHCLRSIAVSLECMAATGVAAVEDTDGIKGMTRACMSEILSRLNAHSVREVADTQPGGER
jgi:hypothetical protein